MEFKQILEKIKDINKFKEFNEMQKMVLKENYLDKNIVVSSPTSSGKTLVAISYAIEKILNKHKRVLYLTPLKALAKEHYRTFKNKYAEPFGLKAGISTGDFDSNSKYLENYHLIFMTYEKLDSLIRHNTNWLMSVGLIVVDEIHSIDSNRGPTLETIIVEMRMLNKDVNILGLSATITNSLELSDWLDAEHIFSNYRPVKLRKGVLFENTIYFDDDSNRQIKLKDNNLNSLVSDVLDKKKQVLVFANTRKSTESLARKLSTLTNQYMSKIDKNHMDKIKEDLDFESLTDFDKKLFELIENGVGFHHAGLRDSFRELIEKEFKAGHIKVIVATTTLAAGINMPAYMVIINSLYRFTEQGMKYLPVKEYLQMAGRAGRAGFDTEGEAIIFAKTEQDIENLFDKFINADPESIESHLGIPSILRMILLGIIANKIIYDDDSLFEFFSKTFYAKRYGNLEEINYKIYNLLEELIQFGFVKLENNKIEATEIGKRVAELYIDPLSAYKLLEKIDLGIKDEKDLLFAIVDTFEMKPYFRVPKSKENLLLKQLQIEFEMLGIKEVEIYDDYEMLDKYFTYLILNDWINEVEEQELITKFGILPGVLHNKLVIAEWLGYAIEILSQIKGKDSLKELVKNLRKRLKYGVKDALLLLVELPGIGRMRARKLRSYGIKGIGDIKSQDPEVLANILGLKITIKLLDHLQIHHNLVFTKSKKKPKNLRQKTLF